MSAMPDDDARPHLLRLAVHSVTDRRGRRLFVVTTLAGRAICTSRNPIVCAAAALLDEGHAPSTQIVFRDVEIGIEESMTLSEATEWKIAELGAVVPLREGRQQ
jgi:hypothetical protein